MEDFRKKLEGYVANKCNQYRSGKLLPLMMPTFGAEEIMEAFDSMVEMNVTMGKKVTQFEKEFVEYLKSEYATMVNSGSSANLLALSILANPSISDPIKPGDDVIVPSVTWSTSIFPIINIGAKPVLVDVDQDYVIDCEKLKEVISNKTKAIIPVHLLGNVCDMNAVKDIADDHKLYVVEDCCEALGSEYKGKKVGTLSDLSSFSFYFSHHITTVEGGMLCTGNFEYGDLARILRAHGYVRHALKKEKYTAASPEIDPRFLFVNLGYNFRACDLQGAFGIRQLQKLEGFIGTRIKIAKAFIQRLKTYEDYLLLPRKKSDTRHSWFAFPITVKANDKFTRNELMQYLEEKGVETRPLVCGNFADQPVMKMFNHGKGDLSNAENIMKNSFYFGIHHNIEDDTVEKVGKIFNEFFSKLR